MANALTVTLDVRDISPRERHPTIFSRFDSLSVGDVLRLVNDHDPAPLRYQLLAERPGQIEWDYEVQGPDEWVVRISKVAASA
ncbi:MAG TPA: DUF2249 domain-containing protein [Ktedonobacterales bacterium]|nr:DUF2249 domain-containing protein [Ktedonobacterales bacterium]